MKVLSVLLLQVLLMSVAHAQPRKNQALKKCNSLASLLAIQEIDQMEVKANHMLPVVENNIRRTQRMEGDAKQSACVQLRAQIQEFKELGSSIVRKIDAAQPAVKALGEMECFDELQDDKAVNLPDFLSGIDKGYRSACQNNGPPAGGGGGR